VCVKKEKENKSAFFGRFFTVGYIQLSPQLAEGNLNEVDASEKLVSSIYSRNFVFQCGQSSSQRRAGRFAPETDHRARASGVNLKRHDLLAGRAQAMMKRSCRGLV
jgi:hypothetical protein